ncbi:hypothetical protein HNY73_015572 [Argiope bruennichi]|uniref:Uncharacterized protein n=1 Tax=Argiope bruennichi TaxID=94029 RepID=A0A8T0ESP1_ARGBR|nr:hypothetical protein HNY73_015572 [Argiope bruennichi]
MDTRKNKAEDGGCTVLSPTAEESPQNINSRCALKKADAWKTFRKIVFLVCLIFVVIQSVEFYNIYMEYPTNIVLETKVNKDFKLPAVTLCFWNTISTESFCLRNPNLCEKPNNLKEFCKKHETACVGNTSELRIPMKGIYTNFSWKIENIAQRYLLDENLKDPQLYHTQSPASITKTFVYRDGRWLKCYSENLHLYQSGSKLTTKEVDTNWKNEVLITFYDVMIHRIALFDPRNRPQVFLGIHSPFIPINAVVEGHAIKSGYKYDIYVQLEKEEHLLPPPYRTSCRDNGPSEDAKNFTNPNSYQMCLEMCRSDFMKAMRGCDNVMTMIFSASDLCWYDDLELLPMTPEYEIELEKNRLRCMQNCKPECLKLQYKYKIVKNEIIKTGKYPSREIAENSSVTLVVCLDAGSESLSTLS